MIKQIALAGALSLAYGTANAQMVEIDKNPFPSTYEPMPSQPVLIRGAHVFDGTGAELSKADLLMENGKITALGENLEAPQGARIIDGTGKWVTPGIIDVHSHLGVYASPGIRATADGNEATNPNTAEVSSEHGVWPHDPGFNRARAGGVTALMVLPGSANLFGGRGTVLKNVPSRTVQGMKFPGAPYALKMACGENPKRVYGQKGGPGSRMGNFAGYRKNWIKAQAYKKSWDDYRADYAKWEAKKDSNSAKKDKDKKAPKAPKRNLQMETLMGVLNGEIIVNMHCYRADEMAQVIDMSKEFGYHVGAFHHAVEAYKVADLLRENDTCAAMWADWGGFKMEAYDSIRENIPLVHKAGACAIVHSDSEVGIQRLNQEAAKALADGNKAGLNISQGEAWTWLSSNPAKLLGIGDKTGALKPGLNADVVLWSGNPFSVYSRADIVFVDGARVFDRHDKSHQAVSDFELGQPGEGDEK
ncbi:MAG: amidohydrolase [Robiginitomaculum sp.]|nr:amidohydrolase [Robiginitomaculum sp.]MDQ7077361.1 amidohydrolase [Robiginitomaculum sp.]